MNHEMQCDAQPDDVRRDQVRSEGPDLGLVPKSGGTLACRRATAPDDRCASAARDVIELGPTPPGRRRSSGRCRSERMARSIASQSRSDTSRKVSQIEWTLCRCRHNIHYADVPIMTTRPADLLGNA
jgi:hypothetical protein